jgi:hypothetical protein
VLGLVGVGGCFSSGVGGMSWARLGALGHLDCEIPKGILQSPPIDPPISPRALMARAAATQRLGGGS